MIGRAGRRTFDKRGNVVFLGCPPRKVCRLLSTNVADLVGNVPLTPTLGVRLFLRAFHAYSKEDREEVYAMTRRLIQHPFFDMGSGGMKDQEQVMHQLLFCLDFVSDKSINLLVNDTKTNVLSPNSLCCLLTHTYFIEPSNFAIITLLQSGLLCQLCDEFAGDSEEEVNARHHALLEVLAGVLFPIPLPRQMRSLTPGSKSVVQLPPMRPQFRRHMEQYNELVLNR